MVRVRFSNGNHRRHSFEATFKNSYDRGFAAGKKHAMDSIQANLDSISIYVFMLIVGSEQKYKILRNLMKFGPGEYIEGRKSIKISGRSVPAIRSLAAVKKLFKENVLGLERGIPIFQEIGNTTTQYTLEETEDTYFVGQVIPIATTLNQLGFKKCTLKATDENLAHVFVVSALVWSDGARVDRSVTYGRIRLLDPSKIVIPGVVTPMKLWYSLLGTEKTLERMSELRIRELEEIAENVYDNGSNILFKIQMKFLCGDNSLLWKEVGIGGGHHRCPICTLQANSDDWMIFQQAPIRNIQFQKENSQNSLFGTTSMPLLAGSQKINLEECVPVVAVMHDMKHCFQHGIEVCKKSVKPPVVENKKLIEKRIVHELKTPFLWNRELYCKWDMAFLDTLNHKPGLENIGVIGAGLSFLCYTTEDNNKRQFYCALQSYSFIFVQLIMFFYSKLAKPGKNLNVRSVYDHGILMHLADQYWRTGLAPIFLSEELGEGSIKAKKKVRTNHSAIDSIQKGVLYESFADLVQKLLPPSQNSTKEKKINKKDLQDLVFCNCIYNLNDPNSFTNMVTLLASRVPEMVEGDEHSVHIKMGFSTSRNICVCGKLEQVGVQVTTEFEYIY